MYDLVIKNGRVIDGTGMDAIRADIAVKDGKIARVAAFIDADTAPVIDAAGLVVTPGFIDSHSHSDRSLLTKSEMIEKAEQGITVSIGGQCGGSITPRRDKNASEFFAENKNIALGSGLAPLIGHGTLRSCVMGNVNRAPTASELDAMKALLRDALEAGARGLSLGLIYNPGCYAETDELIEIAKVAAEYHAVVAAHLRNEVEGLIRASEEFLKIVRETGVRAVFSHHKAMLSENWGKVHHTLAMIDEAAAEGLDVWADAYPYTASSTALSARLIPSALRTGKLSDTLADPDNRRIVRDYVTKTYGDDLSWILVTGCDGYPEYAGHNLAEIAEMHGKDAIETACDIIAGGSVSACYFAMSEADVETVLAHPRVMICTDSDVAPGDGGIYHPRLRGSFPRALGRYVRERRVATLPEMIRKMTSLPAAVYELRGKGILREGFDADICIFDADAIIDRATYTDCKTRAEGLSYVLIAGEVVAENAVYTGRRPAKLLLR